MKVRKLHFNNNRGVKLSAILDSPETSPSAFALLAHCFTCSKALKAYRNIDLSLTASGIAVLRFDFTGIGESGGNFSDTNFTSMIDDVVSAAGFLDSHYHAPKLLIGHSLGGDAIIAAASQIHSARAVVTVGTSSEPANLSQKLSKTKERTISEGFAETTIGGKKFRFKKQFFEDIESYRLQPFIAHLRKPLLILHSPKDTFTPIEEAAVIFQSAKHPKSFISLDDIDHLMLKKPDALYVGNLIAAWAGRYI